MKRLSSAPTSEDNAEQQRNPRVRDLPFSQKPFEPLSHYWIRFPAKFHPPIAASLIDLYSQEGERVLDPFCGSGTLLIEALAAGRSAVGLDIDPVAVFVSHVKTRRYNLDELLESAEAVGNAIRKVRPDPAFFVKRMFSHGSERAARTMLQREKLVAPAVPNLFHWFRPHVVVELARLQRALNGVRIRQPYRDFFLLAFASSLRASSNADPVPVSGLEYTSHMRRLDDVGRLIDPYAHFDRQCEAALDTAHQLAMLVPPGCEAVVRQGDATRLRSHIRKEVDSVITSPPYHNAVDYYRRHQLEMFWLGFVENQADRERLKHNYIGRRHVLRHPFSTEETSLPTLSAQWFRRMERVSKGRAAEFKHYAVAMRKVFAATGRRVRKGQPAVFVVGHSTWNGDQIPTTQLFAELAGDAFVFEQHFRYPIANRYMSYDRKNGANINEDHVLVFRRRS
jgi:SAM-dependent methyltransferase